MWGDTAIRRDLKGVGIGEDLGCNTEGAPTWVWWGGDRSGSQPWKGGWRAVRWGL